MGAKLAQFSVAETVELERLRDELDERAEIILRPRHNATLAGLVQRVAAKAIDQAVDQVRDPDRARQDILLTFLGGLNGFLHPTIDRCRNRFISHCLLMLRRLVRLGPQDQFLDLNVLSRSDLQDEGVLRVLGHAKGDELIGEREAACLRDHKALLAILVDGSGSAAANLFDALRFRCPVDLNRVLVLRCVVGLLLRCLLAVLECFQVAACLREARALIMVPVLLALDGQLVLDKLDVPRELIGRPSSLVVHSAVQVFSSTFSVEQGVQLKCLHVKLVSARHTRRCVVAAQGG